MNTDVEKMRLLLGAVREGFARGENVMALARSLLGQEVNDPVATLLAYDLQHGVYNTRAKANYEGWIRWTRQLADNIASWVPSNGSLWEVGCGEATSLCGILKTMQRNDVEALGFDISWSRVAEGNRWLAEWNQKAELFVADLFRIPLSDNSIDVVYTVHSLEPNGGREEAAIRECLRVARRVLILFEPIYELAGPDQRRRMDSHGYVRDLKATALRLGAHVRECQLLDYSINPMNPSGILLIEKHADAPHVTASSRWQSPMTGSPLSVQSDVYVDEAYGLVYPVLRGIPMLRAEHAIVASALSGNDLSV